MSLLMNNNMMLGSRVQDPDYASLPNVTFHGRYDGLVDNTDNDFGIVASNNVNTLKSAPPHATGVSFTASGTAPTLSGDGIHFASGGRLVHSTLATFNNYHYRATLSDLKWTVHAVVKFGTVSNPNAAYGLFGNNGTSSTAKGICAFMDDRSSVPTNNEMKILITRGTSSQYIAFAGNTNIITPNKWLDIWIQCDKSLAVEHQIKVFINGQKVIVGNTANSSSPVTTPTYAMEIGGTGNNATTGNTTLKEITFMEGVVSDEFRAQFTYDRMKKYNLEFPLLFIDGIQITSDWNLFNSLSEGTYKLTTHLCQDPTNLDRITAVICDGAQHIQEVNKRVVIRTSTDRGRTWSAKSTIYDPAGNWSVQDPGAGYDASGRLHIVTDVWEATDLTIPGKIFHIMSDDKGATVAHEIEVAVPSDSLVQSKIYGNIIEHNGELMVPLYRTNLATGGTNTSVYVLKITNYNTSTPSYNFVLVQANTTTGTYRNEGALIFTSSTHGFLIARDEQTNEFRQYATTNGGTSWTDQGILSFGEQLQRPGPARLKKFQIAGTDVIACYYGDRDNDSFKVIYTKASTLQASGVSAWDPANKFTIHQGSGEHLHYGDICHYDSDFKAIGMFVIDPYPPSGSGTVNTLYAFDVPTFHYAFIKTALGL